MPGKRLTHEERLRIAAGLTNGLDYAEIARRLNRPTSTISREIARNGGPAGYRANRAHQATIRRARRKRAQRPGSPASVPGSGAPDPLALREFEAQFVAMMIQTGLPAMMARVLASLFLSETGSRTSAELVRRLQVSPASISKAVGYLERIELITRERDGGRRRERYRVGEDVWYRTWAASTRSIKFWAATAKHGAEILGKDTAAGARLYTNGEFFEVISRDMAEAAEHWRRAFAGSARAATERTD